MPPALPWLHRGTTAATRGGAPRAVARNGRAAPRTARVTCRASNMVLEVMRVAWVGTDFTLSRELPPCRHALRAKHQPSCKQQEKDVNGPGYGRSAPQSTRREPTRTRAAVDIHRDIAHSRPARARIRDRLASDRRMRNAPRRRRRRSAVTSTYSILKFYHQYVLTPQYPLCPPPIAGTGSHACPRVQRCPT